MNKGFNFMPRNWLLGVVGAIATSLIMGWVTDASRWSLMVSVLVAGVFTYATSCLLHRHDAGLIKRMNGDANLSWDVLMNGIKIGRMTDAQYAGIQREVFGDGRLVVSQGLNVCSVAMNIASKAFVAVPLMTFWLLILAAIVNPDSVIGSAQALHGADPSALLGSAGTLVKLVVVLAIVSVSVLFVGGCRFGFRNYYREAVTRRIRQCCKTAAEGEIYLLRTDAVNEVADLV